MPATCLLIIGEKANCYFGDLPDLQTTFLPVFLQGAVKIYEIVFFRKVRSDLQPRNSMYMVYLPIHLL